MDEFNDRVDISTKPIFLIGNKIDLPNRVVLNEEANEYAKANNIKYFETSANNGFGIKEIFHELYNEIYMINYYPQKKLKLELKNKNLNPIKKLAVSRRENLDLYKNYKYLSL